MPPHDLRRPFKRPAISDQQKRRELSLHRQAQNRLDAQHHARRLASSILSLKIPNSELASEPEFDPEPETEQEYEQEASSRDFHLRDASKLKGPEARKWFASQLMFPEWMIDVPDGLNRDWYETLPNIYRFTTCALYNNFIVNYRYVFARPAGKRCFVVSSNGTTISRLRNGSILHRFPSGLPNGARKKDASGLAQSYCILDCIFHESDQTYYVIDMLCWRGYSLYNCTAEFRFFWSNSKLAESGACDPPSTYHKYRFSLVSVYNCDESGLHTAYSSVVPYVKDGLLFYNKHAHYQTGNTPLALVWKDENCSQYVIDTDNKGQVTTQQQVVLELQDGGKLCTSDDPPVIFGCLDGEFILKSELATENLLRFAVSDRGLSFVDGKLEKADLHYIGKVNRARAFADSYSKVVFQYTVRNSPLRIDEMLASIISAASNNQNETCDTEMVVG